MPNIETKKPEQTKKEINEKYGDESNISITKVKYDSKKGVLEIRYTADNAFNDEKETVLKSYETPHPDFITVLDSLKWELVKLLELPEEYADNMEVKGATIGEGAVITCVKKFPELGNRALCLNTPHLMFESNAQDEQVPLPKETEKAIGFLVEETKAFMGGKRKNEQLKIVK